MKTKALIIYNEIDVDKNHWFINHLIKCLDNEGIIAEFTTSQSIYYSLDNTDDINKLDSIPDLVINRSRDYHLSEIFEKNNIRVFNTSQINKIANDKDLTYQHFIGKVKFLPYVSFNINELLNNNYQTIYDTAFNFGYPFVLKVAEGHGGAFVYLIKNQDELISAIDKIKVELNTQDCPYKKILIQKASTTLGKDLRVYVMGNKIICSIMRTSENDFRSNFSLGSNSSLHTLTEEEQTIVNKVIDYLPADFYGIDFIYNDDKPILNEIEDAVGCRMVYENTDIDIVKIYAEYIITEIKKS